MSREVPVIRLTVESMRHQMMHYLSTQHADLEALVADEIDRVIKSGELEQSIVAEVNRAIPDHIKHLVSTAMHSIRWDQETMDALTVIIKEAMIKRLQRDA